MPLGKVKKVIEFEFMTVPFFGKAAIQENDVENEALDDVLRVEVEVERLEVLAGLPAAGQEGRVVDQG